MPYQAVIFDLGGVAVDFDSDGLVFKVAQLIGRSFEEVHAVVYHQDLLLPLELGRMKPDAYYEGLKRHLKLPWTYEQFVRVWNDIFTENRDVTKLMKRLSSRYKLLALTNTNMLHINHIRQTIPSLSIFHDWVASCEVGLRKPDPQIYALALRRAGVQARGAVYIDDRPELVEAGRAVGLTAIRFEDHQQLTKDLRRIGLEV